MATEGQVFQSVGSGDNSVNSPNYIICVYVHDKVISGTGCDLEHALRQGEQHVLCPHLGEGQRLACLPVIAVMGGVGHQPALRRGLLVRTNLARDG